MDKSSLGHPSITVTEHYVRAIMLNIEAAKFKFFINGELSEAYTIEDIATSQVNTNGQPVQYIGKKDDNGNELYFADIIRVTLPRTPFDEPEPFMAVIEFDRALTGYIINEVRNGELGWNFHNFHDDLSVERVGSFLTNPELIEGAK